MKILKTSFCSVCDRELLSRYNDAFLMMKTSKPFAVFENTTLVYESSFIDEAAAFAIQDHTTRYLYDSVDDVIVTQGYINANKSDYLKGYGYDDYYDDEPVEDDDSDEAEYRAMRDREISSYSF